MVVESAAGAGGRVPARDRAAGSRATLSTAATPASSPGPRTRTPPSEQRRARRAAGVCGTTPRARPTQAGVPPPRRTGTCRTGPIQGADRSSPACYRLAAIRRMPPLARMGSPSRRPSLASALSRACGKPSRAARQAGATLPACAAGATGCPVVKPGIWRYEAGWPEGTWPACSREYPRVLSRARVIEPGRSRSR